VDLVYRAGATKAQEAKSATEEFAMAGFIHFICGLAGSHKGLKATKGGLSKTDVSARSIVSVGLSKAANPIGEQRVYEIWSALRLNRSYFS
jgi:hypothetical protein